MASSYPAINYCTKDSFTCYMLYVICARGINFKFRIYARATTPEPPATTSVSINYFLWGKDILCLVALPTFKQSDIPAHRLCEIAFMKKYILINLQTKRLLTVQDYRGNSKQNFKPYGYVRRYTLRGSC